VASFDEVVPPGKAGSIKASVHTASYKGPIGKQVTVTHDDKSQGPIQLTLQANIVGSVDVLPFPALQLAKKRRGFATPALLIVRKDATEKGSLEFAELGASAPWIKTSSRKVTAAEDPVEGLPAAQPGDIVVSVQVQGEPPVGNHSETISFKTGLPREPKVSVPVTVYIPAALTFQPQELTLVPAPGSTDHATGEVLTAIRDDIDIKNVTVKSDSPAFTVRIDPSGSQAFRLFVDWTRKGKHPATETKIHARAGKESVDLPVRVNDAGSKSAP
jgi:hypothetical protein